MAQLIRARYERGQSLLETVVATAITLTVLASGVAWSLSHRAGNAGTTARDIAALLAQARALASTSGDGATLLIGPAPCPGSTSSPGTSASLSACLFAHRPIGTATLPTQPTNAVALYAPVSIPSLGTGPLAIFVSPSGLVGAASWSPSNGALAAEPVCTTSLTIIIDNGTTSGSLDCASATFEFPGSGV